MPTGERRKGVWGGGGKGITGKGITEWGVSNGQATGKHHSAVSNTNRIQHVWFGRGMCCTVYGLTNMQNQSLHFFFLKEAYADNILTKFDGIPV